MDRSSRSSRHLPDAVGERSGRTQRVHTTDNMAERARCRVVETAFRVQDLTKDYHLQGETVRALRGVTFEVAASDYIAIMGPSGSGKSTLLNLLGCLGRPSSGRYLLGGQDVGTLNDDQLSGVRAHRIGFVFQSYNLLSQLNVLENIKVPLHYQGVLGRDVNEKCRRLAEMVGLGDRLFHRPTELSGGQQQRVAIARSLVNDPYFIPADEATGNLDSRTTNEILHLFETLNNAGKTIIVITHEDEVAKRAKRVIRLRDGLIESDVRHQNMATDSHILECRRFDRPPSIKHVN